MRCCSSAWATSTSCSARTPSSPPRVLGLALTSRDKGPNAIPMAGFPHHGSNVPGQARPGRPARRGLRAGRGPELAKGLVKREVVRVVTPGTLTDDACSTRRRPTTSPPSSRSAASSAWPGSSSRPASSSLTGVSRTELADELARLDPAESLVSETSLDCPLGPRPARALGAGDHAAAVVGLRGRARPGRPSSSTSGRPPWPASASTTTPPRSRPPGPWSPTCARRRRRRSATSTRLTPYRRGRRPGARRGDAPQPGADAHAPRRQARGLAARVIDRTVTPMGARLLADWLPRPLTDSPSRSTPGSTPSPSCSRDTAPARRPPRAARRRPTTWSG